MRIDGRKYADIKLSTCCVPRAALRLPMAGLEPARAYTAQRILSPLRLPFRHIGAAACILSFF